VGGSRGRWPQIAAGTLLAGVAIAAIALAAASGGGDQTTPHRFGSVRIANVAIPAPAVGNLATAAAGANCVLLNPPSEGRLHVLGPVTYHTNPPSSGPHYPVPAHDGIYDPGTTPPKERLVHALEHGRIEIQYRPGVTTRVIGELQSLVFEFGHRDSDPRVLLFENTTGMPYEIAAVAWTHILGCSGFSPATLDAIRDFRRAYDLKAPEQFYVDAE
jgi:Protein of unknown function (DUF3105)